MDKKFVTHPLFHDPTEINAALNGVAGHEQNDGPDYDLMVESATYIRKLEQINKILIEQIDIYTGFQIKFRIMSDKMIDLNPKFVRIVEENFWDLLA